MDEFRLTKDDANFVEVIHTNSGVYGEYPQIGHVDFSVNGGRMQPVCANEANIIRKIYIFISVNQTILDLSVMYCHIAKNSRGHTLYAFFTQVFL